MAELVQFKPRLAKWGFKIKGKWIHNQVIADLTDYLNCSSSKTTWWIQVEYEDYEYGNTEDDSYEFTDGKIYVQDEQLALLLKLKTHV
jgi:hypothetical protein